MELTALPHPWFASSPAIPALLGISPDPIKLQGELREGTPCAPHLPLQPARDLPFLQSPPLHSTEGPIRACFQITAISNAFSCPSPLGVPSPPPGAVE